MLSITCTLQYASLSLPGSFFDFSWVIWKNKQQDLQTLLCLLQIKEHKKLIATPDLTNGLPIPVQYFR